MRKSFIDGFMEYTAEDKGPACYKYWSAVSVVAGAIGRKLWWTPNGSFFEYPNIYVMLVGERNIGKSSITDRAVAILRKTPGFYMAPQKMTSSSLMMELYKAGLAQDFCIGGKLYKNSTMFIHASEAAETFKEMGQGNSIITSVTDLYNSNGNNYWSEEPMRIVATRSRGREEINNYCLNLLAASVSDWLTKYVLSSSDIKGGLASRFLFVVFSGELPQKKRSTEVNLSKQKELIGLLSEIAVMQGGMSATDAFLDSELSYRVEHGKYLASIQHQDPVMWGIMGRKVEPNLIKLSIIFAADEGSMVLEKRHIDKAWAALTELEPAMPEVMGQYGIADSVRYIHEVFNALKNYTENNGCESVSVRTLSSFLHKRFTTKEVGQAIFELISIGKIERIHGAQPEYRIIKSQTKTTKELLAEKAIKAKL